MHNESRIMSMEEAHEEFGGIKKKQKKETQKALSELPSFEEANLEDAKRREIKTIEPVLAEIEPKNIPPELTETQKALAEAMSAGKESEKEQKALIEARKNKPVPTVQQPVENQVQKAVAQRNEYSEALKMATAEIIEGQPQTTKEWGDFVKEINKPEEQDVQSGEGELKDSLNTEITNEPSIVVDQDIYEEASLEEKKRLINDLTETIRDLRHTLEDRARNSKIERTTQSGITQIKEHLIKPDITNEGKIIFSKEFQDELKQTLFDAKTSLKNLQGQDQTENREWIEGKIDELKGVVEEMEEMHIEAPLESTEISPDWQSLEGELDNAELITEQVGPSELPETVISETLNPAPTPEKSLRFLVRDSIMDVDLKGWLAARFEDKNDPLQKVLEIEGSIEQKRKMFLQELNKELEEAEAKLKKKWFFGKGKLKAEINRLNEVIYKSDLFRTESATIHTKPRTNIRTRNSEGFAGKVK